LGVGPTNGKGKPFQRFLFGPDAMGVPLSRETVETVEAKALASLTQLKLGVNEKWTA
jgi:hypothetical protein